MVIAIDGPGGVGKSSVARRVAAALDFDYLDTGATYRAATLAALQSGAPLDDGSAVLAAVAAASIDFRDESILLGGRDVSAEVRGEQVTAAVSTVSAYPEVRSLVVEMQRAWVTRRGDSVVEGRDIGTVVFPDARVKVFLTARPEIRAARRSGDRDAAAKPIDLVAAELAARDRADSTRRASPLQPAEDATMVDTSDMGIDDVVATILALAGGQAES